MNNNLLNMMNDIKIDVEAGYDNGYPKNNLEDGTYEAIVVDFLSVENDKGIHYIFRLTTLAGEDYSYFITINEKTIKFNIQNLFTGIFRMSNKTLDPTEYKVLCVNSPEEFVEMIKPYIINKKCTFTLLTNDKNYQSCKIEL